jgi:Flp pilus assembly protein TadD
VPAPLPPLCPAERVGCAPLVEIEDALDDGDIELATRLLAALPEGARASVRGEALLLEARAGLESGSLAYGAGGKEASDALLMFEQAAPLLENADLAQVERSRALLALGRGQEALSLLVNLAQRYPGDAEVNAALGIAYLSVGRATRSLEPLRRAVRLDPKQPERYLVLGTAQMLLGDLAQAERNFRAAVALDPDSARAQGDLGATLLVRGQIAEGRAHLEKATQLDPEAATFTSNLSYAELLSQKPREAKLLAQRALELDPKLASGWLNLGLAEVQLGDLAAARRAFERAKELDPTDPRPQNNLSDLDELAGKKSGAATGADD